MEGSKPTLKLRDGFDSNSIDSLMIASVWKCDAFACCGRINSLVKVLGAAVPGLIQSRQTPLTMPAIDLAEPWAKARQHGDQATRSAMVYGFLKPWPP